jgi:hypothetical protein
MQSRSGRRIRSAKNPEPADRGGVVCPPDAQDPVTHSMLVIKGKRAVDRACKTGLTLTRAVTAWSETVPLLANDPTKRNWRARPVACTHRTLPATPPGTQTNHGRRTEHMKRLLDVVPRPGAAAKSHARTMRPSAGGVTRPVPTHREVFGGWPCGPRCSGIHTVHAHASQTECIHV